LPVACVAAQEHFWRVSNSSQPTWKWATFPDILSSLLQLPDENVHRVNAAAVGEEIQVGMKHVLL